MTWCTCSTHLIFIMDPAISHYPLLFVRWGKSNQSCSQSRCHRYICFFGKGEIECIEEAFQMQLCAVWTWMGETFVQQIQWNWYLTLGNCFYCHSPKAPKYSPFSELFLNCSDPRELFRHFKKHSRSRAQLCSWDLRVALELQFARPRQFPAKPDHRSRKPASSPVTTQRFGPWEIVFEVFPC